MFKIHKKVEYAVIALKHMNKKKKDQLTSAKEICDMYHLPFDPTSRVLQIMTQHGILKAAQGAHGGYRIQENISKYSLADLTEMIVGPLRLTKCQGNHTGACDLHGACIVADSMAHLSEKIYDVLNSITLCDFIQPVLLNGKQS